MVLGLAQIFPWAEHIRAAGPGVARHYLNLPFFALRGFVALGGLSLVAMLLIAGRGGRALAAIGLILFSIGADFTAVDWLLSLDPRFSSSGFGAEIAIQQILQALAFVLFQAPTRNSVGASQDLAGLTLACLLGALYMETMALIVNWYGDQPARAAWYLARVEGGWAWTAFAAFIFGAAGPIAALLFARVRGSAGALRVVGASVLCGVVLHDFWLMAPGMEAHAVPAAVLALVALVFATVSFAMWFFALLPPPRVEARQGEERHGA